LVTPIRALQAGAARIGTGELDQRIDVRTGDELEALGDQFNSMAAQLKESYAGLERKVEERTHELTESLERQTATGEILRVISSSPTDTQPVFDAILDSATRLCSARHGILFLYDHGAFRTVACRGLSPEAERVFREPVHDPADDGPGRMLAERRPIQIADVTDDIAYRQGDP